MTKNSVDRKETKIYPNVPCPKCGVRYDRKNTLGYCNDCKRKYDHDRALLIKAALKYVRDNKIELDIAS